jgi:hypothetical protein
MKSRFPWVASILLLSLLACNLQSGSASQPGSMFVASKTGGGDSPTGISTDPLTATILIPSATLAVPTIEPSPTIVTPYPLQETLKYESPKDYLCNADGCWRSDGRLMNTSDYFFPRPDESNPEIQALLTDIGLPASPASGEKEEWERVIVVWNWLAAHTRETTTPEAKSGMQYLISLSTQASNSHWPTIAEWAKVYARFHFIPWEGCNYKAFFFAIILYRSGLSPDRFAVAETYWNAAHNGQHLYGIVRQSGKWYAVDPTCVQLSGLSPTPESVGCLSADYAHPFGLMVLPGSVLTKPMLLVAPSG